MPLILEGTFNVALAPRNATLNINALVGFDVGTYTLFT
jgi:hypothetical protein